MPAPKVATVFPINNQHTSSRSTESARRSYQSRSDPDRGGTPSVLASLWLALYAFVILYESEKRVVQDFSFSYKITKEARKSESTVAAKF